MKHTNALQSNKTLWVMIMFMVSIMCLSSVSATRIPYEFYDNFTDSIIDTINWTTSNVTANESGGYLNLTSASAIQAYYMFLNQSFIQQSCIETRALGTEANPRVELVLMKGTNKTDDSTTYYIFRWRGDTNMLSIETDTQLLEEDVLSWNETYHRFRFCYNNGYLTGEIFNETGLIKNLTHYNNSYNSGYTGISSSYNDKNISIDWINLTGYKLIPSFIEHSQTYNKTTYETSRENFIINITYDTDYYTSSSATLYYNNTAYTGTKIGTGNTIQFSKSLDIPLTTNTYNRTFYWTLALTNSSGTFYFNSTKNNQTTYNISLSLCDQPNIVPFLNLTFKDEVTLASVPVTIPTSTFNYYLGGGDVYRTLSFANTSYNPSYAFCASPPDKSIYINPYVQYINSSYQQRIWNPDASIYTNLTTNKTLYLLSTADGLYVTFQVINSAEQLLESVSVNATTLIDGTNTLVGSGTTGADGGITFWLNPNNAHTFNFLLSPYPLYTTTITPTQSSYTITLGSSTSSNVTDYQKGISYSIKPTGYLLNGTTYSFNFTLSSSYWSLDSYGFNITNSSGFLLDSVSDTTSGGGIVNLNLNTGNNESFIMNYYWVINGSMSIGSTNFLILDTSGNVYSIARLVSDFSSYVSLGFFGLTKFGVGIICFVIILMVVGTLRLKSGITDEATLIGVIFALVAFFDVSLGLIPNPINAVNNFPTILMGIIFSGFLFKEVFQ